MKIILFICTGNFYRSRFAEAVFNYMVKQKSLSGWSAVSRGLETWRVPENKKVSQHTEKELHRLNIPLDYTAPDKQQINEDDFKATDKIIALDYKEHHPMILKTFPDYADKIEYWDVTDIDYGLPPEEGLPAVYEEVRKLVQRISNDQLSD